MIKELKKKRTKFGAIISFVTDDEQLARVVSHTSASGFAIAHRVGTTRDEGYGVLVVGHKTVPKFKAVIGHYLTQIRGSEPVVFLKPDTTLVDDGARLYDFLDANRMDRAYAFYLGTPNSISAIIISSTLMEHLFQAVPDQLAIDGEWLEYVNTWLKKALFGGRYQDGNHLVGIAVKQKESQPEASQTPADQYVIEPETSAPIQSSPEPMPLPEKRRPGRPKTKK